MTDSTTDESSAPQGFLRSFRKSEIIFEEGSAGAEMYLIHSGKVQLSLRRGRGRDRKAELAVLSPGEFFGEMALVDDSPRSATAAALEENTQLIALDKSRFLYMVQQQPQFALSVMHTLCQRLRVVDRRLHSGGESV